MNEIWKDINGYDGLYQVSNLGRVKSLNYNHTRKEKIRKLHVVAWGYLQVTLCKNGECKNPLVHQLVAEAFLPNPKNLPEVNHKDENKSNNCVDNLEWVTHKENINFGTRNLRVAEKQSKKVLQYSLDGTFIREWPSASEIESQLKFSQSNICQCCNGKRKTAHGYIWKYSS